MARLPRRDAIDESRVGVYRGINRVPAAVGTSLLRNLARPTCLSMGSLGKDALDNMSMNVGETHVTAAVANGQAFVVEAEQMQDRGVQVVH